GGGQVEAVHRGAARVGGRVGHPDPVAGGALERGDRREGEGDVVVGGRLSDHLHAAEEVVERDPDGPRAVLVVDVGRDRRGVHRLAEGHRDGGGGRDALGALGGVGGDHERG